MQKSKNDSRRFIELTLYADVCAVMRAMDATAAEY
jgi:hypothetical protein